MYVTYVYVTYMLHICHTYVTCMLHMSNVGIWNPYAVTQHICFIYVDMHRSYR